ncbi:hypothetical protein D7X94_14055 [Acutalibacter sp. 1XD8-33]|uniref:hypothetical protein n=1 Tax=Acutalibacter sp. 1XD8-33 TaxID=2320081 RepID=UPI000EA0B582|nr:hypothetical protein [Acutalibacter sp. 1XD8-33]RKJ39030.1 hypothetical protein D7X94_14055 [Acutalibacter sp. 1XD8-33]
MKEGRVVKSTEIPGPEEMQAINRYTRRAYAPEEVYAFSLVLCDNEVDRDWERFPVESLKALKELFLGKTCIFDHECKSANQTARIYQTRLEHKPGRTTQTGEELVQLTARAYLPRTKGNGETIELIESGILKEVSVSCSVKRRVCSVCGKEECKHQKGREYGGAVAHCLLLEPTDAYECSFVAVPAQRGAGVVKRFQQEEVEKLWEKPEDVLLTKAQIEGIGRRFRQLAEKARWGEEYRRELEREVFKYSAVVQPDMPRAVMEAAVKGMGIAELAQMEKTYRQMAQKILPLTPQLKPREETREKGENREFRI